MECKWREHSRKEEEEEGDDENVMTFFYSAMILNHNHRVREKDILIEDDPSHSIQARQVFLLHF